MIRVKKDLVRVCVGYIDGFFWGIILVYKLGVKVLGNFILDLFLVIDF